jgi:hypothetical protein
MPATSKQRLDKKIRDYPETVIADLENRERQGKKINPKDLAKAYESLARMKQGDEAAKARLASEQEIKRLADIESARPRLAAQTARQIHSAPMRRGARSSAQEALNYAQMARRYAQQAENASTRTISTQAADQAKLDRRQAMRDQDLLDAETRQAARTAAERTTQARRQAMRDQEALDAETASGHVNRMREITRAATSAQDARRQAMRDQEALDAESSAAYRTAAERTTQARRQAMRDQEALDAESSAAARTAARTAAERTTQARRQAMRDQEALDAETASGHVNRMREITRAATSAQDARQFAQDARRYAIEANDAGIVTHMRSVDAGLDYALGKTKAEDYADEAAYSSDKARRRATQARQAADEAAMTGARLYDEVRKIEREATMLAGDNKATLFAGQELGVGLDESKHDDMAGKELYDKAGPRADAVDVSRPDMHRKVVAGARVLLPEKDPLMSKRIADQNEAAINWHREQGNFLPSRAGSIDSLNANGYGQAQMPDVNRPADIGEEDRRLRDLRGGPDSALVPISDDVLAARAQHMNRQRVQNPNFRAQNKWNPTIGRGNKFILSTAPNSLQTIRDAQIPYRQPGRRVRGNAVDLVRLGNQTSTKILNQYQP